jgi:hypothetical protein
MRTVLLIPDGVGVRNFVVGRFLRELTTAGPAFAFHIVPDEFLSLFQDGLNGGVEWRRLIDFRQSRLALALQYSLGYAQMYWADTQSMRRIRSLPPHGSWQNKVLTHATRTVGRISAAPGRMRLLERWNCSEVAKARETEYYREEFRRIRPSIVFSSNQRPSAVLPAILAAREMGIPTAAFIFSWDNLSSKGRISAPFDHYLCWSEHMRQELFRYYPDVTRDRAHIVGTPQFEPYAGCEQLWPRQQFFARIGADPSRRLICYSGGDPGTCPEDQEHVRVLMESIRSGRIVGNPQVIVRPTPVEDGKRYEKVRKQFPELIYRHPEWVHTAKGDWSRVVPLPRDVEFLANLTHHCDLNVNLGSTMTLDFGIHDKPVVNIAFDVADPPIFGKPVWDYYYQFEHYRPVVELGAARFARSPEQLAEHVNAYLADPSLDREGRRKLAEMQVGVPVGESCRRVVDVLRGIARD